MIHDGFLFSGSKGFPFQAAFRAFQGVVDIEIRRVAAASIGLGQGEFIVEIGVLMAQTAPASRTRAAGLHFAKPAQHGKPP
jgi:hypothetical protein